MELLEQFGNIDIYLFDQLLKGRIKKEHKILDAGCGGGRNLIYFLRNGFNVWGVDQNPVAIEQVKHLAQLYHPELSENNFRVCAIKNIPFAPESFDWVISNAVFHFAESTDHFKTLLLAKWQQLKPGGVLFARLASDIGIKSRVKKLGQGRYFLPDGSERFLVSEEMLLHYTEKLDGQLLEPIKTTNVQNLRAMTTWVLQKQ